MIKKKNDMQCKKNEKARFSQMARTGSEMWGGPKFVKKSERQVFSQYGLHFEV